MSDDGYIKELEIRIKNIKEELSFFNELEKKVPLVSNLVKMDYLLKNDKLDKVVCYLCVSEIQERLNRTPYDKEVVVKEIVDIIYSEVKKMTSKLISRNLL